MERGVDAIYITILFHANRLTFYEQTSNIQINKNLILLLIPEQISSKMIAFSTWDGVSM